MVREVLAVSLSISLSAGPASWAAVAPVQPLDVNPAGGQAGAAAAGSLTTGTDMPALIAGMDMPILIGGLQGPLDGLRSLDLSQIHDYQVGLQALSAIYQLPQDASARAVSADQVHIGQFLAHSMAQADSLDLLARHLRDNAPALSAPLQAQAQAQATELEARARVLRGLTDEQRDAWTRQQRMVSKMATEALSTGNMSWLNAVLWREGAPGAQPAAEAPRDAVNTLQAPAPRAPDLKAPVAAPPQAGPSALSSAQEARRAEHERQLAASPLFGLAGRLTHGLDPAGMLAVSETRALIAPIAARAGVDLAALDAFTAKLHDSSELDAGFWVNAGRLKAAEEPVAQLWLLLAKLAGYGAPSVGKGQTLDQYLDAEIPERKLDARQYLEDVDRIAGELKARAGIEPAALAQEVRDFNATAGSRFMVDPKSGIPVTTEDGMMFMAMSGFRSGVSYIKGPKLYFVGAQNVPVGMALDQAGIELGQPRVDRGRDVLTSRSGQDLVKIIYPGYVLVFGNQDLALRLARAAAFNGDILARLLPYIQGPNNLKTRELAASYLHAGDYATLRANLYSTREAARRASPFWKRPEWIFSRTAAGRELDAIARDLAGVPDSPAVQALGRLPFSVAQWGPSGASTGLLALRDRILAIMNQRVSPDRKAFEARRALEDYYAWIDEQVRQHRFDRYYADLRNGDVYRIFNTPGSPARILMSDAGLMELMTKQATRNREQRP